jgi:protein dithiol oxidoreductase (disulfide-forming)
MIRTMFVAIILLVTPILVQGAPEIKEGVQYRAVVPELPGAEGSRIQVLEFFMYGCSHCYALEPHIEKWLEQKPEDVDFVRMPAMFNRPEVILQAKVFYALNLIGADQSIHGKIFRAMHVERKRLRTEQDMEEFLQANGIEMDKFRQAMKSFTVGNSIRRAAILAENYDVRGVPAVAVDGKYEFGGLEGGLMIEVMNHLVGKVRKDKVSVATK